MNREINEKLERVRALMKEEKAGGVFLTLRQNVTWITGGRTVYVDTGSETAVVKILVKMDKAYVVCNSSEKFRFMDEENQTGIFELIAYDWFESEEKALRTYVFGEKILCDTDYLDFYIAGEKIQRLRYCLTSEEIERLKEIGAESAAILENTVRSISCGDTELEIAGRITANLMEKGYLVPVCLVGSDERLLKYRHPVPTEKRIQNCAMIAMCAQKYGLTTSVSRIVYFGEIPEDIQKKYNTLLEIDAAYILNTVEGKGVNEILKSAYEKYDQSGYEEDFNLHHQGGALGYLTRDYCVNFETKEVVHMNQAFSWNPTIAGVKLEDTFIVQDGRPIIVTDTGKWIYRNVVVNGKTIVRPDILVKQK